MTKAKELLIYWPKNSEPQIAQVSNIASKDFIKMREIMPDEKISDLQIIVNNAIVHREKLEKRIEKLRAALLEYSTNVINHKRNHDDHVQWQINEAGCKLARIILAEDDTEAAK